MVPIRTPLIEGSANKEATEPKVPFSKVEVISSKVLRSHHHLVDHYGISVSQMTT